MIMADITQIFKATIKTIQTRNKALGRLNRDSSTGNGSPNSGADPSLNSVFFPSNKTSKVVKSEFNNRAKEILGKITKLRDFLLRHRMDYINIHSHLIFEQLRSMSDAERDQVDNNAQAVMRSCTEDIKSFRIDLRRQKLQPQLEEHRSISLTMIDTYMKIVCKIYSEMKAVRVKRVLDRKRLSRIGGDALRIDTDVSKTSLSRRRTIRENEPDGVPAADRPTGSNESTSFTENGTDDGEIAKTTDGTGGADPNSERNCVTWASTSFDEDDAWLDDVNLSPEEIQMFEQENLFLLEELRNTTDDVKKVEGQVIEIARLQEIFSEKILQQEGDINRIGENLMGTTDNLQMANEQIREAIKNNAGFRVWILFFLVVLTFSLLFLDWYND